MDDMQYLFRSNLSMYLMLGCIFCFFMKPYDIYAQSMDQDNQTLHKYVSGIILEIQSDEIDSSSQMRYQDIKVEILEGTFAHHTLSVFHTINMANVYQYKYVPGDKVLLSLHYNKVENKLQAIIYDHLRYPYLLYITGLFLASLLLIGGKQGIKAIITLSFTCFCIIKIYIPLVISGNNPIITSIAICSSVIVISFLIISGFNRKTLTAICGTIGGVIVAGSLAYFIGGIANLTGIESEEVELLSYISSASSIDFKGVLFGGIIMGALGAIMDVSMSISSSMYEIEIANPRIPTFQLIQSGMNVGIDIMGTMSNTLILAYLGGSINVILVFLIYNHSFVAFINSDPIASEIIRAMTGSIGLVTTIPLTAFLKGIFRETTTRTVRKRAYK